MANLKNIKWKHYINYIVIFAATVLFTVMSFSGALKSSDIYMLEKIAIAIMLAVSLSMVVGFLGELSLGHAGFMCVGAYLGGKSAVLLEPIIGEFPALFVSLIIGGLVAALFGVIIGLPALRLRGDYLAIVTLAFGEIVRSVFMNSSDESFGGSLGLDTPRFDKNYLFIIAFVLVEYFKFSHFLFNYIILFIGTIIILPIVTEILKRIPIVNKLLLGVSKRK